MIKRDESIIELITNCPCYSKTINSIYFNHKDNGNRALTRLYNHGYIKRTRDYMHEPYFYYINKIPKQRKHSDYIARAYGYVLKEGYIIHNYKVQVRKNNVIPDLICYIEKNGKKNILPIEIELSHNPIENKLNSYEKSGFKKVLIFSNSEIHSNSIEIINKDISLLQF